MNRINPLILRIAGIAATLLLAASCAHPGTPVSSNAAPAANDLELERVVMLMRHGVRPPTREKPTPEGYARDAWPIWDTPPGHLTPHGYEGAVLMGRWNRQAFAARGLLPTEGCPETGNVHVRTNTIHRTRESGRGFIEGFAPNCGLAIEHADGDRNDPLFDAIDIGHAAHDADQARAAVTARMQGDVAPAMSSLAPAYARLDAILGCCAPPVCEAAGLPPGCGFGDLPANTWEDTGPRKRVKLAGPLTVGGTAAQSLLLEYVEGKPMDAVGWGRATEEDMALLSEIHAVEFDLLARTPYIAQRAATPILEHLLSTFRATHAPALTVLVAHDTNAANVGGALDLHWHVPGYAKDDPAVGGAIGFELLHDRQGDRYVRVFYPAQTTRQLRELQTLDAMHPPYFAYLQQPLCGLAGDPTLCRLEDFEAALRSRLAH